MGEGGGISTSLNAFQYEALSGGGSASKTIRPDELLNKYDIRAISWEFSPR